MTVESLEVTVTIKCASWNDVIPDPDAVCHSAARAAWTIYKPFPAAEVGIVLADDALVRSLNRDYRRKDRPTNVLAFVGDAGMSATLGAPAILGDIVLAYQTVVAEAKEQNVTVADHLSHLVVHGMLHLLGYDHKDAGEAHSMERAEAGILSRLGISSPYDDNTGNGRARSNGAENGQSFPRSFLEKLGLRRRGRGGEGSARDTLAELIEEREEAEVPIDDEERVLLSNILELRSRPVEDVMVPRADIVSVEVATPQRELVDVMTRAAHSRLPVFRETLDDAVGMVHIRDVLAWRGLDSEFRLAKIVRTTLFVAPSMHVLELLLEMRVKRCHLALVVDEFGGIDGLVTIEDLVEEIVGEIEDEHDRADEPELKRRPDGAFDADARIAIGDVEEALGATFFTDEERDEFDTLGGLVSATAGRVPIRGEVITHDGGLEFEILDADPRSLHRLRVRDIRPSPEGPD